VAAHAAASGRLPFAWLALLAVWVCCTGAQSIHRLVRNHQYEQAVAALRESEQRRPTNAKIKRSLGIVLLEAGDPDGAVLKLSEARALEPRDPATLFHLGRAAEASGNLRLAIEAYDAYLSRPRRDASAVRARIHDLTIRSARAEILNSIEKEEDLKPASEPNTIAVPDFRVPVSSDTLRPLSRGIAVIMSEDLGRIPGLKVVERARLQILLDELRLASDSSVIDPRTAPRLGRLLAARRFAQGNLVPSGRGRIQLDALIVDTPSAVSKTSGQPVIGALYEVIDLEKRLVFQVIDTLGVPLTRELRHAIGEPATRSFPAFLAFSRGIDFEERGLPDSARIAYEKAIRLDRRFRMARLRRDELAVSSVDQTSVDLAALEEAFAINGIPSRLNATGTEIGLRSISGNPRLDETPTSKLAANRVTITVQLPP